MKKLIASTFAMVMVLGATAPVLADNTTNATTGPFSRNYAFTVKVQAARVTTRQTNTTLNAISSTSSTGGVNSNFNTTGGVAVSGPASSGVLVDTAVLQQNTPTLTLPTPTTNNATNSVTGPFSTNVAGTLTLNATRVTTLQNNTIVNLVNSNANSGGVNSNFNTLGGTAQSGAAGSSVTIVNTVGQGN